MIAPAKPLAPAPPATLGNSSLLPTEPRRPRVEPPHTSKVLQQQLDAVLAETDTSLRFRVDEQSRRIVVTVLDGVGEVIMQIPDEASLTIARRFAMTGSLLDSRA